MNIIINTEKVQGQKPLLIIVGPTCSGKSSLADELTILGAKKVITTTTRIPRPGERHGVNYYFTSRKDFRDLLDSGQILGFAKYSGEYYGISETSVKNSLDSWKNSIKTLIVEPTGALEVQQFCLSNKIPYRVVSLRVDFQTGCKRLLIRINGDRKLDPESIDGYVQRLLELCNSGPIFNTLHQTLKTNDPETDIIIPEVCDATTPKNIAWEVLNKLHD